MVQVSANFSNAAHLRKEVEKLDLEILQERYLKYVHLYEQSLQNYEVLSSQIDKKNTEIECLIRVIEIISKK